MNKIPGIKILPQGFEIIRVEQRFIEVMRPDGMRAFLDLGEDKISIFLNQLRVSAPPSILLQGFGIVRGAQIARNYALRHRPECVDLITSNLTKFLSSSESIWMEDATDSSHNLVVLKNAEQ